MKTGIKTFFLIILTIWSIYASFIYLGKSIWLAHYRPDKLDLAPYYIAGQILHNKNDKSKIYDYEMQTKYLQKVYLPYLKKINNIKVPNSFSVVQKKAITNTNLKDAYHSYFYYPPNSLWLVYLWSSVPLFTTFLIINILTIVAFVLALKYSLKDVKSNLFF